MDASTRQDSTKANRELIDDRIASIFEPKNSLVEILRKTREAVASTRELLAEVDRVMARR